MLQTSSPAAIAVTDDIAESSKSAVTWAAIIAGAVVTVTLSLILLALGSGFGLISVSPWSGAGASVTTFGVMAAIWLIVTQWLSAGVGGYLTGRLRTKWVGVHTDEVAFRDTAHGLLSWALATIVTVALLASAITSTISGVASGASTVASGIAQGASQGAAASVANPTAYFADTLLRPTQTPTTAADPAATAEIGRILATDVTSGTFSDADKAYLAQVVAAKTGLSATDAQARVNDVIGKAQAAASDAATKARQAADAARKAGAYLAIYTALSMLIGAFIASVAAALGGQRRDTY